MKLNKKIKYRSIRGIAGWMRSHNNNNNNHHELESDNKTMPATYEITNTAPTSTSIGNSQSRRVPTKKFYQSHEQHADSMAMFILAAAGIHNTTKAQRAHLMADDHGFNESVLAGARANRFIFHAAYGAFYWKIYNENPAKIREFTEKFISGADLTAKNPILGLRNSLAAFHRYGSKPSTKNMQHLVDMCLAAYRKWEAGINTSIIKRTHRWVH